MTDKTYVAYLIGPMDRAKDPAKAFDSAEKAVTEAGHTAINPVKEEAKVAQIVEETK
jgi:hypothetical protein